MMMRFTIGDLARETGCKIETIRFYETEGLLCCLPRSNGQHRRYAQDQSRRLGFIRRARELGLSLREVRELLAVADGNCASCTDMVAVLDRHLANVCQRICDLRTLEASLNNAKSHCETGRRPPCSFVETLNDSHQWSRCYNTMALNGNGKGEEL